MTRAKTINSVRMTLSLGLALLMLFGAAIAMADDDARVTVTKQGLKSTIESGQGKVSENRFNANAASGKRSSKAKTVGQSKTSAVMSNTPNTDFWFYTADVQLFLDQDGDGYFYGVDLLFDADTIYDYADVYAVIYLSHDGGPWEEYAVTDNFTLLGATSDDEYIIVTELVSGYPTGSYDILIELFDAWDDSFVADFGPADTSELAYLPLEDANRDEPGGTTIIVHEGGGGAPGWILLSVLGLLAAMRRQV